MIDLICVCVCVRATFMFWCSKVGQGVDSIRCDAQHINYPTAKHGVGWHGWGDGFSFPMNLVRRRKKQKLDRRANEDLLRMCMMIVRASDRSIRPICPIRPVVLVESKY